MLNEIQKLKIAKKSCVSLVLVLLFLLNSMFMSFAAGEITVPSVNTVPNQNIVVFNDVAKGFWANEAIEWMSKNLFIKGYPDGSFKPDATVSRAQFAQIVMNCAKAGITNINDESFEDVAKENWAFKAIQSVKNYLVWYKNDNKNYFKPDQPAVREEVAVALAKLFGLKSNADEATVYANYSDESKIKAENKKFVALSIENNIIKGMQESSGKYSFNPESDITRAQLVQMIYNAIVKNNLSFEKNASSLANVDTTATTESYVATIGDEKVSQSEFDFFHKQTKNRIEGNAKSNGYTDMKAFWENKIEGKDPKEVAMEQTFAGIKEFKVELANAKAENTVLAPEEVVKAENEFKDDVEKNGGEKVASEKIVQALGVTLEQYKAIIMNFKLVDKFLSGKEKTMVVSDEARDKYYTENKTKYDNVTVVHVLFLTTDPKTNQPGGKEIEDAAEAKAKAVLERVKNGEDIKALAKKLSEDPGVTQNDGEYTFAKTGQMVKEFEDWAFSAKLGESGIVKTSFGYHVMKKIKDVDEVKGKESAKTELQRNAVIEIIKKWLDDPKNNLVKNEEVLSKFKF